MMTSPTIRPKSLGILWDEQSNMLFLKSIDMCDFDLSKIAKRKILS